MVFKSSAFPNLHGVPITPTMNKAILQHTTFVLHRMISQKKRTFLIANNDFSTKYPKKSAESLSIKTYH
jgi:predicted transcriptional regulator YheO